MKRLYMIGGTMGVGKTTVCNQLKSELKNSVFLDGDWCWDANPFQVSEETKAMVIDNICYLLKNFIHSTVYENVIFCWVMHQQSIIDSIIKRLDSNNCKIVCISLIADENAIRNRLKSDIDMNKRYLDIMDRSISRIPLYQMLNTIKIDTTNKTIKDIVEEIKAI